MAETTYSARAIILRRTRLKETDLIVTALAQDGRQIRAVAKGARKPSSPFSARLELYTEADLLLAKGRGDLDIVKEARIFACRTDGASPEFALCAALAAETAEKLTHSQVASPRLYPLTSAVLDRLSAEFSVPEPDGNRRGAALCAAYMLKSFAFAGLRPSFAQCSVCGCPVDFSASRTMAFSVMEGGAVCPDCRASSMHMLSSDIVAWAAFMLSSPFDVVLARAPELHVSRSILRICRDWMRVHAGANIRTLGCLLDSGLF